MATALRQAAVMRNAQRRLVLVPHNMGSRGARALAATLTQRLGFSVVRVRPDNVLGRPSFQLRDGTDKLTQFQRFQNAGVSCPDFTTAADTARLWIRDGNPVMCRTLLRGSEGRGIIVAEREAELVAAPLYTKYVKKKKEFRVHVLNGAVIDVQEKRRRSNYDGERDTRVRNLANGYVFCRGDIVEPPGLRELALAATASLGYNLGAVDVAWNERSNTCFVLEVNSTPGMEGTTLEKYADAIIGWYRGQV